MPKGYWLASVNVDDFDAYKKYIEANGAAFAEFGGRFLVRGGRYENPEGTCLSRQIVLEFPSYEKALACFESDLYQAARAIRLPISTSNLVIVEGYDD